MDNITEADVIEFKGETESEAPVFDLS